MINKHLLKKNIWIELQNPNDEEIKSVIDEFGIDASVAHELTFPSPKPKIEMFKNYIYMVLHFPAFRHSHSSGPKQEVDFVIGKNFLITSQYDTIDSLHKFSKEMEVERILKKGNTSGQAWSIFFRMIIGIYDSLFDELSSIEDWVQEIEKKIFDGEEKNMVFEISQAGRELLTFKKIIGMHGEVLESFNVAGARIFGDDFSYPTRIMLGEYKKLCDSVDNSLGLLSELRETNNSLLSTKQNEDMKVLTTLASVAIPASLIISLFQIDTIARPIVGNRYDFWIILGIIAFILSLVYAFFKHKRLL